MSFVKIKFSLHHFPEEFVICFRKCSSHEHDFLIDFVIIFQRLKDAFVFYDHHTDDPDLRFAQNGLSSGDRNMILNFFIKLKTQRKGVFVKIIPVQSVKTNILTKETFENFGVIFR